MTAVKLFYFDIPGGRGEDCRLALHLAGVEFEDKRIDPARWPETKPTTPYGAMPVLEIAGEGTLAQSNAILGLIGSRHGLLPADDFAAAGHRALMSAVEDLRERVIRTMGIEDNDETQRLRRDLAEGYMAQWVQNVQAQIAGPFVGGAEIGVADLKLFVVMNWFKNGVVDYIGTDYFEPFDKLSALHAAVAEHPKVVEWYAR